MQIQQMNLDGTGSSVSELQNNTNAGYLAIAEQTSGQGDGYHVVLGQNLDPPDPSERTFAAFASNGQLVTTNLKVTKW